MKRLLLICNPRAGKGISGDRIKEMLSFYLNAGFLPSVYFTKKDDDLSEILNEAQEGDHIVACGGDGMMNTLCSAVQRQGRQLNIGYLPQGTTNDFAKSIGIPFELQPMLETSISENISSLDIGCINDSFFMYVACFGVFTDVSYKTPQKSKNAIGYLAYVLEGVKSIADIKKYHLRVRVDDEIIEDDFIMGFITNSRSVAGMKVLSKEDTRLDDGLFELILIRFPSSLDDLRDLAESVVMTNTHARLIVYRQGSSFEFEGAELSWGLDGEFGGSFEHTEINVKSKGINIRI